MFAVRPICVQDSTFKMSSENPVNHHSFEYRLTYFHNISVDNIFDDLPSLFDVLLAINFFKKIFEHVFRKGVGEAVRFLVVGTIGKEERPPQGQLWMEQYLVSLKYWPF